MTCPICDQKPTNCDCTDRERRMYRELNDVEELRLTDEERAALTRAIETLEGVDYMEAFATENDATAANILRGLLERCSPDSDRSQPIASRHCPTPEKRPVQDNAQ